MTVHKSEEDAALEAYMAGGAGGVHTPDASERLVYLRKRYQEIKSLWLWCFMQIWEGEQVKSDPEQAMALQQMRKNMKERAWVVQELRQVGEKVEDPFSDLLGKLEEEGAVNAYSEGLHAGAETPKESDYKDYCQIRYEGVKKSYKDLLLLKAEAEALKNNDSTEKIIGRLRLNFKQRMVAVKFLRRSGVKIEDPFVPNSAT